VKKVVFFVVILALVLSACNRKKFVNKLEGTWKLNKYIYLGSSNINQDETASYDTSHYNYQLVISGNDVYTRSWVAYQYRADSLIRNYDSIYDTLTTSWTFKIDTQRFVDTTVTPYSETGRWFLNNSEEDLELISNADTGTAQQYRILELTKGNLNLSYEGYQFNFTK
jgi:hypothetical protein